MDLLTPIAPTALRWPPPLRPACVGSAVWSYFQTKANPMPVRSMGVSGCVRMQSPRTRVLAGADAPCDRRGRQPTASVACRR